MKKNVLLYVLLAITIFMAHAQPIIPFGQRLPDLYYWDTNWLDSKVAMHPESYALSVPDYSYYPLIEGDVYIGRPCITDSPIKVIGIAAAVEASPYKEFPFAYHNVIDTNTSNRKPEYLRLYQKERDNYYLKGETRWDTLTPQYQMAFPDFNGRYETDSIQYDTLFDFYLTFFDVPVIVHDTFIVGGTTSNNMKYGYDTVEFPDNPWQIYGYYINMPTRFPVPCRNGLGVTTVYPPNPQYYVIKHLYPYYYLNPLPSESALDTSAFEIFTHSIWPEFWLPFFVIFDTNFVYDACMGVWTTGVQVESMDAAGVALTWNDSGVEAWQVEVKAAGADSGMLLETPINYLLVTGLEQGRWYEARVRTLCDSFFFGEWSLPVQFYLPTHFDTCMLPTGFHVAALDSGSVTLAWNNADVLSWTVQMNPVELGMANVQTLTATTNSLQVEGLYTDAWYWARIRVLCDTDWYSDWTDTIRFHVPSQHPGNADTTNATNPVEQYTYLLPNPAREEVTVMSSFKVRSVELYAADGKLLMEQEVNGLGTRLSLEGLSAGVYFVRVRTSAGVTTKRLVVE